MHNMANARKRIISTSGEYSNRIRKRFKVLKIPISSRTGGLPTDLGDIREVCNQYLNTIDMLFRSKVKNDKKYLIQILQNIYNDLYIHLSYHLKEMRNPLNLLIKTLENEEEKEQGSTQGRRGKKKGQVSTFNRI